MELEGFIRGIKVLNDYDLHVDTLVTDRHRQLGNWVRENLQESNHRYDVWHMAKSEFRKKLFKCNNLYLMYYIYFFI